MSIWDEIKTTFRHGTHLTRLIYINVAVFLAVKIIYVIYFLLNIQDHEYSLIRWLAVPADPGILIRRPWTLVTYMFLHENFLHILFNLLWLFWFGRIFLEYLDQKKLLGVYMMGGLAGAFLYILAYNVLPVFNSLLHESVALGASAAVYAIVIAIATYVPNHTVYLMFIGPVKIKYIALFVILLDILSIASSNAGGHIAHLGGAVYGYLFAVQYRRGNVAGRFLNRLWIRFTSILNGQPRVKVTYKRTGNDYEYLQRKADEQKEIDRILDKIAKGGYESLTREEKNTLFNASKKR